MKLNTCSLIFLLLWLTGAGNLWGQVKQTKVDKSFNVNSNTTLRIDNTFGKVHINTWDQNKIQAKIEVEVDGSGSEAQEIFDRINVDVHESSGEVRLETDISESRNSKNHRFRINYTISMPRNNPLVVDHRHGDIYLDKHNGSVQLDLAHGQIVTEELTGSARVSLQHGNGGRIAALGSGTLEIQHYHRLRLGRLGDMRIEIAHTTASMEAAGDLDMEMRHSTLDMGDVGELTIDMQHSKIDAGTVAKFESDMQHSSIDMEGLTGSLSADCNHSHVSVDKVSRNFGTVSFDGNHSFLGIGLESGASATLELELHHGRLHYSEGAVNMSHVNIENNSREYRGKIGNGSGGAIKVDGNFTDVDLKIN